MVVEFRPVSAAHINWVAEHMRVQDLHEIRAFGVPDPHEALEFSVSRSSHSVTALAQGEPIAILGVTPGSMATGTGLPWLLGTDGLVRNRRSLVRWTPVYIRAMLRLYPTLANHVHVGNTVSIRWLRQAGFTLHPAAPFGPLGELFHRFEMKA